MERAVRSVLSQTMKDLELIIVDDGSTDGSVESLSHIHDDRIRVIRQSNAGECAARNTGIRAASYEYVALLDADDEWLPHFLSTISGLMSRFPDCGAYATAYYKCYNGLDLQIPTYSISMVSPQGTMLSDYFASSLKTPIVCSSAVVLLKRAIEKCGGFPVGVRSGGDLYTWARLALAHKFAWSPLHCAIYHLDSGNYHMTGSEIKDDVAVAAVLQCPEVQNCSPNQLFSLQKYINRCRILLLKQLIDKRARKHARIVLNRVLNDGGFCLKLFVVYAEILLPNYIVLTLHSFLKSIRK